MAKEMFSQIFSTLILRIGVSVAIDTTKKPLCVRCVRCVRVLRPKTGSLHPNSSVQPTSCGMQRQLSYAYVLFWLLQILITYVRYIDVMYMYDECGFWYNNIQRHKW